jgi:hypothetical protein
VSIVIPKDQWEEKRVFGQEKRKKASNAKIGKM